jgi:outer membrane protein
VTKTDVALAQSRLETAISDYTEAENRVRNAAAEYARVTGEEPNYDLEMPSEVANMPRDLGAIESVAGRNNRSLLQSLYSYKAKQEAVKIAITNILPAVSMSAYYSRSPIIVPVDFTGGGLITSTDSVSASLKVSIPIFSSGGADYWRIKSAKYAALGAMYDYQEVQRVVNKRSVEAWSALVTSKAKVASNGEAVKAAKVALEGTMHESTAGFRTSFDVLIAEQELLRTSINLEESKFGYMTALYSVLHVMGDLTEERLLHRL